MLFKKKKKLNKVNLKIRIMNRDFHDKTFRNWDKPYFVVSENIHQAIVKNFTDIKDHIEKEIKYL